MNPNEFILFLEKKEEKGMIFTTDGADVFFETKQYPFTEAEIRCLQENKRYLLQRTIWDEVQKWPPDLWMDFHERIAIKTDSHIDDQQACIQAFIEFKNKLDGCR